MVAFNPPANNFGNSNFRELLPDVPVPKLCTCRALVSSGYIGVLFTFLVTVGVTEGITCGPLHTLRAMVKLVEMGLMLSMQKSKFLADNFRLLGFRVCLGHVVLAKKTFLGLNGFINPAHLEGAAGFPWMLFIDLNIYS